VNEREFNYLLLRKGTINQY